MFQASRRILPNRDLELDFLKDQPKDFPLEVDKKYALSELVFIGTSEPGLYLGS
jgi:hypothetical protein